MPVCSHCGKEVSEGIKFCPECGERLKKGFTSEEREKYIQELEAPVEEEKPAKKAKTTKKQLRVGIVVCIISVIAIIAIVAVCVSGTPMAEVAAIGFLEDVTGYDYVGVDLSSTKLVTGPDTLTGLKAGEYRWRVEGTVQHKQTKTKYTVRIFVDELPDRYWRNVSIYMAQGVNVPAGQLIQLYP